METGKQRESERRKKRNVEEQQRNNGANIERQTARCNFADMSLCLR